MADNIEGVEEGETKGGGTWSGQGWMFEVVYSLSISDAWCLECLRSGFMYCVAKLHM